MYSIIHLGNNNIEVIISMILTMHNQLTLLHDLLEEQLLYKSVTEAEYKRIKALVRSIMAHQHNSDHFSILLPELYYYSIKGENAHSFIDHITENEANIKKWLQAINQIKKETAI